MADGFQRARQPAQKEQRRAHLVATARALLVGGAGVRSLSLNGLARRASMAKANVYRYFETREALLLVLLAEEWQRWFADLRAAWPSGPAAPVDLEGVAALLARSLAQAPLLCELTAALPSVLEQNLTAAAIGDFKRASLALFADIADVLAAAVPAHPPAVYAALLHDAAHLLMGLYPALHPSPAAQVALEAPELAFFRRDFAVEFERMLTAIAADHRRRDRGGPAVDPGGGAAPG
jgi:AcrR family transcriptional regulator